MGREVREKGFDFQLAKRGRVFPLVTVTMETQKLNDPMAVGLLGRPGSSEANASCPEIDRAAFDLVGRGSTVYHPKSAYYTAQRRLCSCLRVRPAGDKVLP